ncbi:MAG: hypothetical protein LBP99_00475 [Azoarcus sp.]|jgi:hypothetical protein|nr:hypothetical protein [Azoarcus sp.]
MSHAVLSFLLTVLIEAVNAIAAYLKHRLFRHLGRPDDALWENHPEFV